MSLIPGQTASRLALFGTVLVGATFCPTLAAIVAGTAAPAIISTLSGMVAGVFGGLVANDMGELAKRLETQDKTNHDLAKATGAAIALVILNLAEIEGIDQTVQKNLKTLAIITEKEWLKVSLPETSDKVFLQIPETELVKLMSNNVEDFATVTALTEEAWLEIVNALAVTAKTNFPDYWYSIIAFKLHQMFPQALREILKQDAEKGGKAYAAMSLSLMGEIAALSAERGDFSTEQIAEIKAYFEQLVKGSDSQQQELFCQLMQQVESGFAVVLEAAKQEILEAIQAVNERLGVLSQDVKEIKEILNTKPRFGVLIGGNFSGVCAYWQGREKEIEQLKNWIRDPEITLMGIEGSGGLGKTSLAEKVFDELKTEYYGYWADVSTGAIFTEVARKVLEHFNFPIPQQETELVQALISGLQQTKCLLVFDNLETLLQDNEFVIGSFYDEFFRSWTNKRSESAIVVTTRERPNIRGFNHWIPLEGFEETEGAAFLQGKGIKNNQEELKAFSRLVDGYPLLLRLVADLLIDDSPQNPRLERLTELGLENLQQLLTHPDVKGNHRQREVGIVAVLDASYQRLSEQLKTLLTAVTILRGEFDAEIALAVSGLEKTATEIQQDLRQLVRRSWLLESENRLWSFQPVILAYLKHKAGEQTAAHLKAIDFYQNRLKPRQQWQTLDDVNEYLQIFYHCCQLGQYSLAFNTINDSNDVNNFLDLSGYNSTSVELYYQLVENWQPEGKDENWRLSTAWQNLGNASTSLGQYSQAIKYHEKSLEIAQEIGEPSGIANSLMNLGRVYYSLGQYQRTLDFCQQGLEIQQEIGEPSGVAKSLGGLGSVYYSLGQYQRALDFYQQSLEIQQEIGEPSGVAKSLGGLGSVYYSLSQYQRALDFYQQSLEIQQEIGDRTGVANSLMNLGNVYCSLGQYQRALDFYQQSLEIQQEIGDRSGVAASLVNLGNAYYSLSQYQQALDFYQQGLEIAQEIGDRRSVAAYLQGLGIAYDSLGQYEQALDFCQQGLEIAQEIGDRRGVAASLQGLGIAYDSLGQYQQALNFYQQGLEIAQEIGDRSGVAASLVNLGNAYYSLSQYQQALDFYQQGLEIAQEIGDIRGQANAWFNTGNTLKKLNRCEDALGAYRNARELFQNLGLDADVQKCDHAIQQLTSPSPLSARQSQGFWYWLNLQIRRFWRWLWQLGRS